MATDVEQKAALPHNELIRELLDSRIPKSEREHAAAREIERLRENVDRLTACTIEHRGSTIACSDAMFDAYSDERRHANDLADALRTATAMLLADYPETAKRLRSLLHE